MIFVLATEKEFEGQLQFKVLGDLLLQKLPTLNYNKELKKMEPKEEIISRIQLSLVKKEIKIRSVLERPFDIEQIFSKISLKKVYLRTFANSDLILIQDKINEYTHCSSIYGQDMKSVIKFLNSLNQHLGKDVIFELSKKTFEKIDKQEALIDEIIANENDQSPSEIVTDRAFLLSH